jgi:hypothetical protein
MTLAKSNVSTTTSPDRVTDEDVLLSLLIGCEGSDNKFTP